MSDLAASHDEGTFEPDEETLMSALRNQDDIPILMDIVRDSEGFTSGQETHLRHSIDEAPHESPVEVSQEEDQEQKYASPEVEESENATVSEATPKSSLSLSQEQVTLAIHSAMEKHLPTFMATLVEEVMQELHAQSASSDTALTPDQDPTHRTTEQGQMP
ncbi:hypothetical protein [Marinomonas algarum]|uniref:Uncharacterized protein n=1 Tax=Marinomonas algarum TaxID=2883105 RepID=A0A9X1IP60_9GAMM|nr:hypothetical protein [Marinomonas algarum]MCB5162587.1 hypothetical protein [Marinomonas algarum]